MVDAEQSFALGDRQSKIVSVVSLHLCAPLLQEIDPLVDLGHFLVKNGVVLECGVTLSGVTAELMAHLALLLCWVVAAFCTKTTCRSNARYRSGPVVCACASFTARAWYLFDQPDTLQDVDDIIQSTTFRFHETLSGRNGNNLVT